jgi:hypothetical protein
LSKTTSERRSSKQFVSEKRDRAIAQGQSVMAEIAAQNALLQTNTSRLKELRLAKEAADRDAQAAVLEVALKT